MTSESLVNMPSIFSHSITDGKGNLFNDTKIYPNLKKTYVLI